MALLPPKEKMKNNIFSSLDQSVSKPQEIVQQQNKINDEYDIFVLHITAQLK